MLLLLNMHKISRWVNQIKITWSVIFFWLIFTIQADRQYIATADIKFHECENILLVSISQNCGIIVVWVLHLERSVNLNALIFPSVENQQFQAQEFLVELYNLPLCVSTHYHKLQFDKCLLKHRVISTDMRQNQ